MKDERTLRAAAAAEECRADWAILTSVEAVAYAAGHVASIEAGPSPFDGGPTVAVVAPDGEIALLVNETELSNAEESRASTIRSYESLGFRDLAPLEDKYSRAASELLDELSVSGTVAVEFASFPAALREILVSMGIDVVSIDRTLERQRSTKTPLEVQQLRHCAEITGIGQEAALRAARVGRTELDIFTDVRHSMESFEGMRLPMAGDLVSGAGRTSGIGGWPGDRNLQIGDPVICDLAPRVGGYWGDSCNTIIIGEAEDELSRMYECSRKALNCAVDQLRPGITAHDFDASVRRVIEDEGLQNPIHIGHGIGTSVHEWPRLVPGNNEILRTDMILMIEPGAYQPGVGGVRLEWMFRVTETGNEILSNFDHVMFAEA